MKIQAARQRPLTTVPTDKGVTEIVRTMLAETLGMETAAEVDVRSGVDHDGDDVFWVTVVLADFARTFDAAKLVGFTRDLRLRLPEDAPFPILRYLSKEDSNYLKHEPA